LVDDVWFGLELAMVAVGWQVWVFWLVGVGLVKLGLGVVVLE
jgi:hypothetical protein